MNLSYTTGRHYNGHQVLESVVSETSDDFILSATFKDSSRGLAGKVELIGYDLMSGPFALNKAILNEYDNGRYTEVNLTDN